MINRNLASALVILGSLVGAGQALADWQYTRWGMSPREVIEASGGAGKPHDNPADNGPTQRSKVVAPYRSGEHLFRDLTSS